MVLGKLLVPGRPTNLDKVGQGPIALAEGAGGDYSGHFYSLSFLVSLSPSFGETARYRLKYLGPLNPKQPTNQLVYAQEKEEFSFRIFYVSIFVETKQSTQEEFKTYRLETMF